MRRGGRDDRRLRERLSAVSGFRSGVTDFAELRRRREELFGPRPGAENGTENGVDVDLRTPEAPRTDPGHYPGY